MSRRRRDIDIEAAGSHAPDDRRIAPGKHPRTARLAPHPRAGSLAAATPLAAAPRTPDWHIDDVFGYGMLGTDPQSSNQRQRAGAAAAGSTTVAADQGAPLPLDLDDPIAGVFDAPRRDAVRLAAAGEVEAPQGTLVYGDGAMCVPGSLAFPPDRATHVGGPAGDAQHLDDYLAFNEERLSLGQNAVGPAGEEQAARYEAAGRVPGAQWFGLDHDMQTEIAALEAARGEGWVNVDVMKVATAGLGWLTTEATAPALMASNDLLGTNLNPAMAGTTLAQWLWGLGGYDVPGSGCGLGRSAAAPATQGPLAAGWPFGSRAR